MTPGERESIRDIVRGAAATLLLFLAYAAFPLIGTPAGIVAPFPAIFYSLKQGRNCGVAIVLMSGALLVLVDPSVAVLYLFQAGGLSLLMAEFLGRGNGGARSIAGSVAAVAAVAAFFATAYCLWWGIDLTEMVRKGIAASIAQTGVFYQKSGFKGEELAAVQEALKQSGALIGLVYPALLILLMIFIAGMNLLLVVRNSGRLARPPLIGPFTGYRNPDPLIWLVIVAGFSLLVDHPVVFQASLNVLIVTLSLYFIQGLAIIVTFFERFSVSPLMRGIFYVVLALQPYLAIGVTLLGLFDLWLTFRTPKQGENL